MAQNQDFECRQCGMHFDSKDQLDTHNRQQHSNQAQSGSSSPRSGSSSNSSNSRNS